MDDSTARKEVEIASREAVKISEQIETIKIRKDTDLAEANEVLLAIKRTANNIEKKRKAITQPLNASLKEINAMFKEPASKLKVAETIIKAEMLNYQDRVDRRAAKRIAKIQDQVDSGELDMSKGMEKMAGIKQGPSGIANEGGTTSFKTTQRIEIEDVTLIPAGYFMRERVLEAIRMEIESDVRSGAAVPPGSKIIEVKQVAVRAS